MDSDTEFTVLSEKEMKFISSNFHVQTKFTPAQNFFTNDQNILLRMHAVSIIAKHSKSIDPDTFIPYLAMNYFDRFVSKDEMILKDVEGFIDTEKVRLIAITCLAISAKMRMKYFSVHQFLRDMDERITPEMVFETELLILDKLHWEMQPLTAFTFLNYYYHYFKTFGGFKRRCIYEIIVQAQGEHIFVHYMPTLIAFSAFLAASKIAYPSKYKEIAHPFILSKIGPKEQVEECAKHMVDLCKRMNIQIETPESESHSTSKIKETQQNKGKTVVVVDSSEEEEDEETALIKRRSPMQVEELSVSDYEVIVASGNEELSDSDKKDAAAKEIEAIKRRHAECKGKIMGVTEIHAAADDDKSRVEAIIRQAWDKSRVEGGSILEIVELLVVPKKLMIFELKWSTELQLQHSQTVNHPNSLKATGNCGCSIG